MTQEILDRYQRQAGKANERVEQLQARYDAEYASLQSEIDELKSMFELAHQTLINDLADAKREYDEAIDRAKTHLLDTYRDGDPKTNGALQVTVSKGKLQINNMGAVVAYCEKNAALLVNKSVKASDLLATIKGKPEPIEALGDAIKITYPRSVKVLKKKFAGLIDGS